MLAVNVGLGVNIMLAVLKVGIGVVGHSPALLADGINSTSDVVYGIVVSICMRLSGKPADSNHPYGHDQMESIAAVVVGAFVMTTGVAIFWNSIDNVYGLLFRGEIFIGGAILTFWIAVLAITLKIWLTWWTTRIGKKTRNTAVMALAHDHRNDIFASLAAALGIFFGMRGYSWIDPFAGALVSLVIFHTGVEILRTATADLMDTVPGRELALEIKEILRDVENVLEIEEIHAHRFGPYLVVNITIGVEGTITVIEGDRIATGVEQVLLEKVEFLRQVYVHYHPANSQLSTN